jgi:V/A-type H+-transporting ATPase subunit C
VNLISTRYAFTSAYLKGEEARSIISDHIDEILHRSKTVNDVLDVIRDTDIGDYLSESTPGGMKTFTDFDDLLWRYLGDCLERLLRFSLPSDLIEMLGAYSTKYDILNIKTVLRGTLAEETALLVPIGNIYKLGYLEELSDARSVVEIAEVLVKADLGDYGSLVNEVKEKDHRSIFETELKLDSVYFRTMLNALKHMNDGTILVKALGIMIDLANIQIVFRSALSGRHSVSEFVSEGGHMLSVTIVQELLSLKMNEIPGRLEQTEYYQMAQEVSKNFEKERVVSVVDRTIEKYKVRLLSELLSPRALSPCNLLWYLLVKEFEIRNIRMIMKTLMDGIPSSEIQDYVVAAS